MNGGHRSMHILYATLIPMDGTGGNTIHVQEVVRELARQHARVTLVASGKPRLPLGDVEFIDIGRLASRRLALQVFTVIPMLIRTAWHVVRLSRRVDVLYSRDNLLGGLLGVLAPLVGLPLVFECNGLKADETRTRGRSVGGRCSRAIANLPERFMARRAAAIVCVTQGIKEILAERYQLPSTKLTVVPNGVNLELFTPDAGIEDEQRLRRSLGLQENDAVVMYLGTLQPWQDLPTLVSAVARMDVPGRRLVLLVVGDGRERTRIAEQAERIADRVRVIFTGAIPYEQVARYVRLADVCSMPFTKERNERIGLSPIKLYAYLACGKPIVASRIHGFEFLEHEALGTLVPCADPDAFAAALETWLTQPGRSRSVAGQARQYAVDHCGWDRTARSVLGVCQAVAGAPETRPHAARARVRGTSGGSSTPTQSRRREPADLSASLRT